MKLKFYSRGSDLVRDPLAAPFARQRNDYVGRKWDAATFSYPASEKPYECDSGDAVGRRLTKLCGRDASLWVADEQTATHCRVPFVKVKLVNGAWLDADAEKKRQSNAKVRAARRAASLEGTGIAVPDHWKVPQKTPKGKAKDFTGPVDSNVIAKKTDGQLKQALDWDIPEAWQLAVTTELNTRAEGDSRQAGNKA